MSVPERNDDFIDQLELPPIVWLTLEESKIEFDQRAREVAGVSGDEFIRRLKAGEYDNTPDDAEHWDLIDLSASSGVDR